jgi:hypothetical protein
VSGNLHTHSYWSDEDDFPEMIMDWYKTRGYDFTLFFLIIPDISKAPKPPLGRGRSGGLQKSCYLMKILLFMKYL